MAEGPGTSGLHSSEAMQASWVLPLPSCSVPEPAAATADGSCGGRTVCFLPHALPGPFNYSPGPRATPGNPRGPRSFGKQRQKWDQCVRRGQGIPCKVCPSEHVRGPGEDTVTLGLPSLPSPPHTGICIGGVPGRGALPPPPNTCPPQEQRGVGEVAVGKALCWGHLII